LTAEQQARVQEILQKTRQQAMASRQQESSEEERRTRMRQMREQARAQIRTVLTEEQRQKYAELFKDAERQRTEVRTDERPGRVWILNGNRAPEPTALRLGISDDTYTEVVSGDLSEGQDVITGILTTATRTGSAPPGFGSPRF
jgi:HlyD family secretion protein